MSSADSVTAMVSDISTASDEQARGVEEITRAMSQLDQVTQQNAAVSEQAASAAEQLSSQADSLRTVVDTLIHTIKGGSHATAAPRPEAALAKQATANVKRAGNVIPLKGSSKRPLMVAIHTPEHGGPTKRAVGVDIVPSENDSRFQDI